MEPLSDLPERLAPTLLYLYGPPAVGKLTVAERLKTLTDVVHRLRLDVFRTAMAEGRSLIFTNNSAWGGSDGRARFVAFAAEALSVTESEGVRRSSSG
jgi:hypothetical protein